MDSFKGILTFIGILVAIFSWVIILRMFEAPTWLIIVVCFITLLIGTIPKEGFKKPDEE